MQLLIQLVAFDLASLEIFNFLPTKCESLELLRFSVLKYCSPFWVFFSDCFCSIIRQVINTKCRSIPMTYYITRIIIKMFYFINFKRVKE
jgi:hypothetical protein